MTIEHYDPDCAGCRPALIDAQTGTVLAEDHPDMVAILKVWDGLPEADKAAFHRVTCLNGRDPQDMATINRIITAFGAEAMVPPSTTGTPGKRVTVRSGDGSKFLGEGTYIGDVMLYYFYDGFTIRSITNTEERPDEATIEAMAKDGFRLMEDPENPKIVLDDGAVVYGCQVWWDFL